MNKSIKQLEQEAKQAREVAAMALSEVLPYGSGSGIADKLILAAVAMVTYQFALGMQEVSGDGSGKALPEFTQDEYSLSIGETVVGKVTDLEFFPDTLPEASQEERDSDGWIEWGGGDQPVDDETMVKVKFRGGMIDKDIARRYYWKHDMCNADIIAYRIVK